MNQFVLSSHNGGSDHQGHLYIWLTCEAQKRGFKNYVAFIKRAI